MPRKDRSAPKLTLFAGSRHIVLVPYMYRVKVTHVNQYIGPAHLWVTLELCVKPKIENTYRWKNIKSFDVYSDKQLEDVLENLRRECACALAVSALNPD